jgi:hypothetical protein
MRRMIAERVGPQFGLLEKIDPLSAEQRSAEQVSAEQSRLESWKRIRAEARSLFDRETKQRIRRVSGKYDHISGKAFTQIFVGIGGRSGGLPIRHAIDPR